MKDLFTKKQYDNLKRYLQSAKCAAIITHTNPDGDAIGSSIALAYILEKLNISSNIIISNDFPEFLHWIDGSDKIMIYSKNRHETRAAIKTADLIFCIDFNSLTRIEILENIVRETTVPRILIDHHVDPADDFDLKFSYYPVSSTSELVYRIGTKLLGTKILPEHIAEAVFCGMMTDSGAFSHSSSYPDFFKIIANLLDCGVDKDKITHLIYDNFTENRMKLLGYALSKMVVLHEYHAAYITLSREDLNNFNFRIGDTEGFVNYPLSIKGIILSLLLIEKDDHIKLSIRSQGNFDVNEMARKHFHGGGHLNASGGKMLCKYEHCNTELEKIIKDYEEKLCNT
ncbi:MAG: DHH family phosphoesterase [Prevotellaceae bacterium]|jgi:phosphoesterase RecJ-like protein|nr:DHH family phosphoesterase [Prevotellaceae bacterium]